MALAGAPVGAVGANARGDARAELQRLNAEEMDERRRGACGRQSGYRREREAGRGRGWAEHRGREDADVRVVQLARHRRASRAVRPAAEAANDDLKPIVDSDRSDQLQQLLLARRGRAGRDDEDNTGEHTHALGPNARAAARTGMVNMRRESWPEGVSGMRRAYRQHS